MNRNESTAARDAILDFLRHESPLEWERLASIGRLVNAGVGATSLPREAEDLSYTGWLRATFGMFGRTPNRAGRDSAPGWPAHGSELTDGADRSRACRVAVVAPRIRYRPWAEAGNADRI
jgi:hypothetical protein